MFSIFLLASLIFSLSIGISLKRGGSYFAAYVTLNLMFMYIVVPVSNWYFKVGIHEYYSSFFLRDGNSILYASFLVLVFAFSYFLAFVLAGSIGSYIRTDINIDKPRFAYGLFFVSVSCFLLFAYSYGGVSYVYENASKIRSGLDEGKNYLGAFFKLFTYYIEYVVFFFFARIYYYNNPGRIWRTVFFLAFFVIALIKSLADGGRGGIINLLIGLIFIVIAFNRWRLPKIKVAAAFVVAVFVGLYGKIFLFQLFGEGSLSFSEVERAPIIDQVVREYSHQFSSLVLAVDKNLAFERFYIDYFIWLLKPLKFLGVPVLDSISYFNTYQATGVWDSEIPPGVIAFNYYQGGFFGVALAGFIVGALVKWIDGLIANTVKYNSTISSYVVCAILFIYMPFAFLNADPALFIQWVLVYIILFVYLFARKRLRLVIRSRGPQ